MLPKVVRIPERFRVHRVGLGDYRVQSASQNVRVTGMGHGHLIERLAASDCPVEDLLAPLQPLQREEATKLLSLLWEKGVLEEVLPSEDVPDSSQTRRYEQQRLLFSHFGGRLPSDPRAKNPTWTHQERLAPQERIVAARVTVIGLGRVGSGVVRALGLAGVGSIRVADSRDVFKDDVWSGGAYAMKHVGLRRSAVVRAELQQSNPTVTSEEVLVDRHTSVGEVALLVADQNLVVLCPDQFVPEFWETVNRACCQAKIPWLGYISLGFDITIGPLVLPGESACYKCAELRSLSNLLDPVERGHLYGLLNRQPLHTGVLPIPQGVEALVTESIKFLSGFSPPSLIGHVLCLTLGHIECRLRSVLKLPRCPHCRADRDLRPSIDAWCHVDPD